MGLALREFIETCAEIALLPALRKRPVDGKAIADCGIPMCKKMFYKWVARGFIRGRILRRQFSAIENEIYDC